LLLHAAKKSVAPQVALNSSIPVCNMLPGHGFFSLFLALIHFGFITFPYPFCRPEWLHSCAGEPSLLNGAMASISPAKQLIQHR
jgi:hypothetical protein